MRGATGISLGVHIHLTSVLQSVEDVCSCFFSLKRQHITLRVREKKNISKYVQLDSVKRRTHFLKERFQHAALSGVDMVDYRGAKCSSPLPRMNPFDSVHFPVSKCPFSPAVPVHIKAIWKEGKIDTRAPWVSWDNQGHTLSLVDECKTMWTPTTGENLIFKLFS